MGRYRILMINGVVGLGILATFLIWSCSNSSNNPSSSGSIVGFATRSDAVNNSGISVKLYHQVSSDPNVVAILNQYYDIGFALTQSAMFDHRTQTELRTTTTDSTGRYAFGNLGNGAYAVVAEYPGYGYRYELELSVNGDETRPDSTLILYPLEDVPSQIIANTTWYSGHHYRITDNVTVAQGAQLTIEPGTFILLGDFAGLDVQGSLYSVGDPNQFIHWIRDDTSFAWNQVRLLGSGQNQVEWNLFNGGIVGLQCYQSNLNLLRSLFVNFTGSGVSLDHIPIAQVESCLFLNNIVGFSCAWVDSGMIRYNLFSSNNTGLKCENYSYPTIQNNWIGKSNEGIFLQYVSQPGACLITHNQIEQCSSGIRVSGDCFPTITYNEFTNDSIGIAITPITGGPSSPIINHNNLTNIARYSVELLLAINTLDIDADSNWWGTTNPNTIELLILDGHDPGNHATGIVDYTPYLTSPEPSAGIQ
jgi:hypothetical protein